MNLKNTCRILIVDDSPSIHEDFRKVLGGGQQLRSEADSLEADLFGDGPDEAPSGALELEINTALQGEEGLAMVRRAEELAQPYAVAFVDGRMPPGWDGLETIERMQRVSADLQFVFCTAYSDYSWQEILDRVGRSDNLVIIKKPFDNVEVQQMAQTLARKWLLKRMVNRRIESLDTEACERSAELCSANEELAREMTERLNAEAQLQELAKRFLKVFEANPLPMSVISTDSLEFRDVNAGFLNLVGRKRDQVLRRTPEDLGLCSLVEFRQRILEPLLAGQTVKARQLKFLQQKGQGCTAEVSADLLDLGDETCVLMVSQDITERLALENQLRQAQKLEAVGQLAAGIAHDFNNLVTIIMGHAELQLATGDVPADLGASLQQINAAAQRAAGLTRQLLAFSRREPGATGAVDLKQLVDSVSQMIARILGENIELQVTSPNDLPPVEANAGEIEQVLVNLAVNSRDAMPKGGKLRMVSTAVRVDTTWVARNPQAREGDFVCLAVMDQGCGMDAATLKRIFEPFFTTKPPGKGTGMGLASVFGIVRQHKGWIEVDSELGKGSTFSVFLPVSSRTLAKVTEARPVSVGGNLRGTILLVEDEAEVRQLARGLLTRQGYSVLEAADGPSALDLSRQHSGQIDVMLTDVVMPGGLSGIELAERLRSEQPEVRVVFTSGHNEDILRFHGVSPEGANFIQKPFSMGSLLGALNQALAN